MKSKAPLALMEQLIMVLVFALAAAFCLQSFALSDRISRENLQRDQAVILAQNAAEICKSLNGDLNRAADEFGGQLSQGLWYTLYNEALVRVDDRDQAAYQVDVLPGPSGVTGLGQATVSVYTAQGDRSLLDLTVAWQEEVPHG